MTRDEFKAGFADRLKRARKVSGLGQWRLAGLLSVSRSAVCGWENPDATPLPDADNLAKLCETLCVSADWLLFGKEI